MRLLRSHFTKQNGMNKNQYKHFTKPVETKKYANAYVPI